MLTFRPSGIKIGGANSEEHDQCWMLGLADRGSLLTHADDLMVIAMIVHLVDGENLLVGEDLNS